MIDRTAAPAPVDSGGLTARDAEQLRLLVLGHRILAAITFLFACFPLIHVAIGVGMLLMPPDVFEPEHGHAAHGDSAIESAEREEHQTGPEADSIAVESDRAAGAAPAQATEEGRPHQPGTAGPEEARPAMEFERAMPRLVGGIFLAIGGIMVLSGWTLAVLMALAGHRLRHRRSRTFCLIVAGLECLFMPLGTVLGVFTIIVLMRPSVESAFVGGHAPADA